ncbi:MAG: DUF1016 family protein, partial [Candidatus Hydrogenedentes bacterium]|nr:DUF1016 family protein [Candidatus Hydrogenedentota bacterium]
LNELASELKTDLWTLDGLLWKALPKGSSTTVDPIPPLDPGDGVDTSPERFALEKHMEEFLVENWARTELGRDWTIHSEDGEEEIGNQYSTGIGFIDILAKHKKQNRWLVVELKRGQTSDQTVGQVLRYIGWVRKELAKPKDNVEGLIIAREADDSLRYAVSAIPDVNLKLYEVKFSLKDVSS